MSDDPTGRGAGAIYLGIDVGSTITKAIAFDAVGTPMGSGAAGYEISRPSHDRAEQDARQWIDSVDSSVATVAGQVDLSGVRSIGVTSQVDTHVVVDEQFTALLPALLWQDLRCAAEADELNTRLGEDGRFAGWGDPRPLDTSNPVPRALWLARHEPRAWEQCRWLLLPKDLVNAWLTGTAGSDPLASFKVVGSDGAYVTGVKHGPGLADRLPALSAPEAELGRTRRSWHGIAAGTVVATGTMDGFGNVLGCGLHRPGDTMVIIGTSVIVAAVGVGGTSGPGVVNFAPFRGRQVHAGPTQSGGDSLKWWARATGHSIDEVLGAAVDAEPGCGGVVFAPHLLGERAPLWDDEVRSWFTGISSGTGFAELSRAVLEGVAHSARELLEAVECASTVPAPHLVLSGGGSRSLLWCQIVADVTGREVRRSRELDTAVVGAATLAASALTGDNPWDLGATLAQEDVVLVPDPTTLHDDLHAVYRDTYEALRPVHHRLREIRNQS